MSDPAARRGPLRPSRLAPTRVRLNAAELRGLFRTLDTVGAMAAATITATLAGPLALQPVGAVAPLLAGAGAGLLALPMVGAYTFHAREPLWRRTGRVALAALAAAAACLMAARIVPAADLAQADRGAVMLCLALMLTQGWAFVRVARWRKAGRLTPNLVVVGATEGASRLIARALDTRDVNILGVFDDRAARAPKALFGVPVLGGADALLEHKLLPFVDRVVVAVDPRAQARVAALMARLRVLPNEVTLLMEGPAAADAGRTLEALADAPLDARASAVAEARRASAKRLQDIVIASLMLLAAAPAMLLVALAVKLESPGPVFFRQKRHGFNHETITVWKFRSMCHAASDANAHRQISAGDDRVTRVGAFIRRTSLDELPQLLNVLSGEMSLVGPRPHAIGMKTAGEDSHRLVEEYAWRHRVKPGLTGWAQINGSRGPVDTAEAVRERVAYDIAYIGRQSFWFDLYIMLMTAPRLIGDRAAVR